MEFPEWNETHILLLAKGYYSKTIIMTAVNSRRDRNSLGSQKQPEATTEGELLANPGMGL